MGTKGSEQNTVTDVRRLAHAVRLELTAGNHISGVKTGKIIWLIALCLPWS
jgi:ABC-type tungstate transport system substrate-binding protein